jgi:D-alanyl-lipoteichoic acid acyltransferase DltB (MBOAT superfamily)
MAVGIGRILGYDLIQNFNLPYFAASIQDFWRRWHISLTTWFRDYLYFPMGGRRVRRLRWAENILVVFIVSGLWHGASWTFAIWGALHGFYYLLERLPAALWERLRRLLHLHGPLLRGIQIVLTFNMAAFAWIFFRASSINDAWFIARHIFTDPCCGLYRGSSQLTTGLSIFLILFLLLVQTLQASDRIPVCFSLSGWPTAARWSAYAFLVFGISMLGVGSHAFIYLQF